MTCDHNTIREAARELFHLSRHLRPDLPLGDSRVNTLNALNALVHGSKPTFDQAVDLACVLNQVLSEEGQLNG